MRLPSSSLDGLSCRCTGDLAVAGPAWRALEAVGIGSPYQRFDWVSRWQATQEKDPSLAFAVWTVTDGSGAPVLVLPVELTQRGPARIARVPGGRHANFAMPWIDRAFARSLDPRQAASVLTRLGEAGGADLIVLANQPCTVDGIENPFARLPFARPTPEPAVMADLAGGEARLLGRETRKKFARKKKALLEVGPVRSGPSRDPGEALDMVGAFMRLKADRCAEQKLPNPFAVQAARWFLKRLAVEGTSGPDPVFELHALWCGERIVAVFGATRSGSWLSGSILAHDPKLSRCSPGELLLLDVVDGAPARGIDRFDLGVGAMSYKSRFCPDPLPLVDLVQPVSLLGQAAAPLILGAGKVKAAIKRDPRLMGVVRSLEPLFGTRS